MSELVITQDILAPETSKTLTITGNHPSRLLSRIPSTLPDLLMIDSSNIYEDELKWDASEPDKNYFWGRWRARVKKDQRTTLWFEVKVQGEQNTKDKHGKVTVRLKGVITSRWKFSTPIDKALGYFYLHNVYANQRLKYIEEGKADIGKTEDGNKSQLSAFSVSAF